MAETLNNYDNTINKSNFITNVVDLKTGTYTKYSVLGRVTADGEFKLSENAASDGSETASVILLEEITVGSGVTKSVGVMVGGMVDIPNNLVFGTGQTVANTKDDFRQRGINLRGEV